MSLKHGDDGKFIPGSKPPPEQIEAMQAGRERAKAERESNRKQDLLRELGFTDPIPTDIDHLADIFLAGKQNSISSHTKLLQRSPKYRHTFFPEYIPGEPCPTCKGKGGNQLSLTLDEINTLLAGFQDLKEKKEETQKSKYVADSKPEPPELTPEERGFITVTEPSGILGVDRQREVPIPTTIPEPKTAAELFNQSIRDSEKPKPRNLGSGWDSVGSRK